MEQQRHRDFPRRDYLEDFRVLRESSYWPYLQPKIQEDMLIILDAVRSDDFEDKRRPPA